MKLVHGIGINDADYQVTRGEMVDGKWRKVWDCPFYSRWASMLERVYGKSKKQKNVCYVDCEVAKVWHSFMNFKSWMEQHEWEGKHLDKDLLVTGNKVYGPDNCVFLNPETNAFISKTAQPKNGLPLGVFWAEDRGKYRVCVSVNGKTKNLGSYSCQHQAHLKWKEAKHQQSLTLADKESDPRAVKALRVRYL